MESLESRNLLAATVIAGFSSDYQEPTPAENWAYLWNDGGAIGDANNYTPLLFNGVGSLPQGYDVDGTPVNPGPGPGAFAFLRGDNISGPAGGHPGDGIAQGSQVDRFAIAAYTVADSGDYSIGQSEICVGCFEFQAQSTGIELLVYVNDTFVPGSQQVVLPIATTTFDVSLGTLNAGDTIYVAVGPDGDAFFDSFNMDFNIQVELDSELDQLILDLEALNLQQGLENTLDAKINTVETVLSDLNQNNDVAAVNNLYAFINIVEAQRGNHITDSEADDLIAATWIILELLGEEQP